jgi:hypothetical protein
MTTTSTGAHKFQTRHIIMLAVAVATAAAIVFVQWAATQPNQQVSALNETAAVARAEASAPSGQTYSLTEAYNNGMLDEGWATSTPLAKSAAAPHAASITGGHQEFSDGPALNDPSAKISAAPRATLLYGGVREFSDRPAPSNRSQKTSDTSESTPISGGHQE